MIDGHGTLRVLWAYELKATRSGLREKWGVKN